MENTFSNFFSIDNFIFFIIYYQCSNIILLSSRSWIKDTLVQYHYISCLILSHILEDFYNFSIKMLLFMIDIIQIISFLQVRGVIQNGIRSFSDLLLSNSNFIIQVPRNRLLTYGTDNISRNSPTSQCYNPIINSQLRILF